MAKVTYQPCGPKTSSRCIYDGERFNGKLEEGFSLLGGLRENKEKIQALRNSDPFDTNKGGFDYQEEEALLQGISALIKSKSDASNIYMSIGTAQQIVREALLLAKSDPFRQTFLSFAANTEQCKYATGGLTEPADTVPPQSFDYNTSDGLSIGKTWASETQKCYTGDTDRNTGYCRYYKAQPQDACWLCGSAWYCTAKSHPFQYNCEHVLPYLEGATMLTLAQGSSAEKIAEMSENVHSYNPTGGSTRKKILKLEYRWSHNICNQFKNQGQFMRPVKIPIGEDTYDIKYYPDDNQINRFVHSLFDTSPSMVKKPGCQIGLAYAKCYELMAARVGAQGGTVDAMPTVYTAKNSIIEVLRNIDNFLNRSGSYTSWRTPSGENYRAYKGFNDYIRALVVCYILGSSKIDPSNGKYDTSPFFNVTQNGNKIWVANAKWGDALRLTFKRLGVGFGKKKVKTQSFKKKNKFGSAGMDALQEEVAKLFEEDDEPSVKLAQLSLNKPLISVNELAVPLKDVLKALPDDFIQRVIDNPGGFGIDSWQSVNVNSVDTLLNALSIELSKRIFSDYSDALSSIRQSQTATNLKLLMWSYRNPTPASRGIELDDDDDMDDVEPTLGTPAPPRGGLFSSTPAPSRGGLFSSAPAPAPSRGGLFNSAPAPTPAPSGGGLFSGAPAPAGLFSSTPAPSGGGLFSSAPAPAPSGGGLFSSAPASAPTGGGLFSGAPVSTPAPSGGGLFSGATTSSQGAPFGGAFSSSTAPAPSRGGLFSSAPTPASAPSRGGLFSSAPAPSPAPSRGGLFSSAPTPASAPSRGGLFSSAPAPSPAPSRGGLFSGAPTTSPQGAPFGGSLFTGGRAFAQTPTPSAPITQKEYESQSAGMQSYKSYLADKDDYDSEERERKAREQAELDEQARALGLSFSFGKQSYDKLKKKLQHVGINITKLTKTGKRVPLTRKELEERAMIFTKLQIKAKKLGIKLMYNSETGRRYKSYRRLYNEVERNTISKMSTKELQTKLKLIGIRITHEVQGRRQYIPRKELERRALIFKQLQIKAKKLGIKLMYNSETGRRYKSYRRLYNEVNNKLQK